MRLRAASECGSAPRTARRRLKPLGSSPASRKVSMSRRAYEGMMCSAVVPKSFISAIWRRLLPAPAGIVSAPSRSEP